MNPQITVGSWFRVFTVGEAKSVAQELLSNLKLDYSVKEADVPDFAFQTATIIVTKERDTFSLTRSTGILVAE